MKSWATLDADVVKLVGAHRYTAGRAGASISEVVVHHNAGINTVESVWELWQYSRAASAHYQVESGGRIGQLVWDRDTAWHAADQVVNRRSIGVEVSNSGGELADWPITDTAVTEAGRLVGAICRVYGLGAPVAGRNVTFHRDYAATSCPYHLAPGGKYHAALMAAAVDWYQHLTTDPDPEDTDMGLTPRQSHQLDDLTEQLTGSPNPGEFPGWPQLDHMTPVDYLADLGARLARIEERTDQ
ncbi:N-acetylmuramoyl-L-alanine amidase [Dietzia sp. 179-F 9C3 NHS]|uniref:N-acetylmuramoyl-L-alanine amidase n=1 Tax=Dietzia sp. 179-F 9C3 NHS TaxID=3374295 RepID=UPI00387A3DA3